MNQHPTRRIVVDIPSADHQALKSVAANSGESLRGLVLQAIHRELTARQRALSGPPAPRANP